MDFQTAVRTCLQKYVDFNGTAKRPEFWWWVLFIVLGGLVLSAVDRILFGSDRDVLGAVFSLATLLPTLAVGARRLHDVGRSAWWLLLGLIPIIGQLILLYWYVQPSKTTANQFA
jgi:uncharacterized membrane protein YhaH (DUF805 family)